MKHTKVDDIRFESEELVFSNGASVMLRHVNTITPQKLPNIGLVSIGRVLMFFGAFVAWQVSQLSGLGSPLLAIGLIMSVAGLAITVAGFASVTWYVSVSSSSGQTWLVRIPVGKDAQTFSEQLQSRIRESHKAAIQPISPKPGHPSLSSEIHALQELHAKGTLTEEEFTKLKASIINKAA